MFDNTSNENLSNKGIQVDLGEYLEYKKQFNDTRTISYSSSDLYHKRKKEQEEARSDFFIYGGASAVSAKVLYEKAKKDEGIRALISEVPGAKLLKQKLTKQYLDNQAAQIISGAIDPRSTAVAPLSQSLQSILVSLEELSPSQILKTLQLSSFNSLFVEVIDEERKKARHIKQTSIQVYENYYKNLIFKESKIKLMDEDIKHGFILQNNKLYQAVPVAGNKGEVKAGRVLLDYATVVNSTIKTGDNHHSVNRVFEKFSNIYDANLNRSQLHTEPFVIVGGASKKSTVATWAKAYGRFSLEIGAKSLDNPLGFLEEYLDMTGLNNSKLVKNKYFQTAKGFTNFKLGTGGVYNISSAEMMKKIGKNLAIKGAAGVVGLNIIDATLDALTPDSSVWSSGLVAGMADTFMKAHVKFAELWSDNFQDLKKSQENSAPESTKLSTLIGVPLAGAMTGANLAFFKRMRDTATKGLEQSSAIHTAEQKLGGLLGKAADKVGINIVGNTLSRYSKVGALLGATLTLPFLPGALVGKSSEELRQEYSGEKEVAVRKDRGWLCMTPDTPIFSSVGYSRAEDIKTGDFLYNRYGTKNKVISVHKRYTKELAYEFKTAYSTNLWTTVTADHKVLTSNGWVPANKINVGDYVVTGIPKLNINSKLLDLASYVNTEKHITETAFFSKQKTRNPAVTVTGKNILCNRYIKIDYQFGLFLGWFLAEGCVSRDKNGKFRPIEISFHKTEENFAIEILEYLNKLTGNTKEIKIYPNQGEGRRIRYSNSILSEFLISFMYRDGVKIFPDLTLFNKECVKGFLIGMFYGDGSITKHKNVRNKFKLKSQYIQHLFEYRRYLSVFGIYGSIYQDRGTGCFILELSGQCSDKANELGLYKELYSYQSISKNFNCRSYYIEDEKVYVKVEKISVYEYEGYVYDYTMENIHEYTPNSFVIHNSGGTEYEGGQIKYFRQNLLRTIASDAKTKTLYGDRETKRRLDPVFNPIKYLRNPYRFEEMHQEDMPFPVWGMDVSYGSVLGQLYKGTVGELIKPTVIHPEFLKLQSEANPNLVLGVKGEIVKGISETISGKSSKSLSKLSAGNSEENSDTSVAIVDSDAYTTPENERKEVKSLIADGLMLRANAPTVSVLDRTLAGTSASLSDFTGLKGFSSSLLLGAANLDPTEQLRPELEVSGSSTSFSDTLSDANLGDMLGCFVPETKVLTSEGYKEIQHIQKGDLVLSKDGIFQKVNKVFEKEFKNIQILKVSIGLGYEDIYCTADHVFPSIYREKYTKGHLKPLFNFVEEDREIGSLDTGSLLILPDNKEKIVFDIDLGETYSGVKTEEYLYPFTKYERFGELYELLLDKPDLCRRELRASGFSDSQSKDMLTRIKGIKSSVTRMPRKLILNNDLGKLIGWWLAEGCVDSTRINISMHKKEIVFAEELKCIIKTTLGVESSIQYSKENEGMCLRFNHKPFSEFLLKTFGDKAYNKNIPEQYLLNTSIRQGLLFGLCHGDGWFNKDLKKGGYTSISKNLCEAVSRMLRYEGILNNVLYDYDNSDSHILPDGRQVKTEFYFRNNVCITQQEAFNRYLNILEITETNIINSKSNYSYFRKDSDTYISIKTIEVLPYTGLMYDLNVENTPYYTVNGVLCHNSGEFSRRLIPQSAAVKRDTVNPMRNQVAPDWLPKNETKYYKNFERGNYYCLAPNSLLETNTLEVKKACEIKVGDKLLGKFGKDTVVKNIETIPSQEVLKITINGSNNIPTYLTGEHPVAIRFKTYGESKSSEKTKIYRILKLLKNTSKGVSYPKNYFYKDLEVSIPTFSSLFKQMEQEGYIINNKKNIIRTYKDLPDEYLFENNIYFKEAKDLKVGDYVAYPKYREKLDIIEEFDLATIPGWSAISENYVYYTRTPESVIEFEWLRGESDIKPKSHINMSITKENSRDTRKARFDRYLKLDKNFGLFCGLWLAEGFKNGTTHHVSEHEFVNNIYNNSPLETYKWCPVSSTNGAQMRYSCKALDMFLEYTFGSGAKFKHLNNYLLHTPEEFIKGLIEGYYFGDGTTYNNKGRYSETATSASDKLLIQLKLLMIRRLGVVSILNDYKYNPKPVVINGVINGIDSGYKQNLVIRRQDSNSNLWTQDENFYYFRINKIEKEPCNVVYAFETSDNTFCTYSMLTHNSNMENGEYLLPGSKGFETLNPELKGIDPNNYPLVYQYKILQNVARGSSEHIAVKKYLAEHLDELSEKEKDVFFEAYGQDTERDVQKRFTDYKTGSEKSNMGVIGLTQNAIWESFSHLESPLEPLTPFRPMAKFVHQRTAVEDYIKTQLMGSDVGIWTNSYSHFLKPTLNRLADSGSIDQFKPKEAIEKENVDTYFDKLSLVKAIKTNDTYDIERNITALSYLGINDPGSMKRFKSALPEGQSAYVEAFSQEKDKKKRNQILSLVPKDIGRAYQSIWSNIDIYDQAILRGKDPNKALEEEYLKDSKKLKSAFSIDITRQDKETIHNQASTLANDEDKKRFEQYQEAKLIRLKAAQKEATEYVENQTGSLPSDNWIGWDPRLTIDDIKLKTLTIGREDIHRFGYWQKDLERSERLIGLKEGGIVNELENIKAEKRSNVAREFAIRSRLRNIGFEVSTINSVPSNSNQLKITDKQEYLRAYNNSV